MHSSEAQQNEIQEINFEDQLVSWRAIKFEELTGSLWSNLLDLNVTILIASNIINWNYVQYSSRNVLESTVSSCIFLKIQGTSIL